MDLNWNNYPKVKQQNIITPAWRDVTLFDNKIKSYLPHGNSRSYGDVALNQTGTLIKTTALNHLIEFDHDTGILRAEAGCLLNNILTLVIPKGWMLPVVPGTSYITLGGAVANDVHGKNHHSQGSFGCHVTQLELQCSDGKTYLCSQHQNTDYFAATIGGLGLTGFITWVEFQLMPIQTSGLDVIKCRFNTLDEFFQLSEKYSDQYEYTVAWLDTTSKGKAFGRGYFSAANHSNTFIKPQKKNKKHNVPFYFPSFTLNKVSASAFNNMVYHTAPKQLKQYQQDMLSYLFPLDNLLHWNRIYGRKGFLQYQFVLPKSSDYERGLDEILNLIVTSGQSSFLSVLKMFGEKKSAGLLAFPEAGVTLALDFPFNGKKTLALLTQLDAVVQQYQGKLYPAKDARMSADSFRQFYPRWQEFQAFIDPQFNSDFARRVMLKEIP